VVRVAEIVTSWHLGWKGDKNEMGRKISLTRAKNALNEVKNGPY